MRRRPVGLLAAILAAVAIAAVWVAVADRRSTPPDGGSLVLLGDSLNVGVEPYLPGLLRHWNIRADDVVGRPTVDGLAAFGALRGAPGPLVVSLGTNDDPRNVSSFQLAVAQVLALAGPSRCVVWANIVRPPAAGTTYDGYNRVLLQAAERIRNFRLVDWATMVRFHPEMLAPDGVHTTPAGYRARAAAIVAAIRSC